MATMTTSEDIQSVQHKTAIKFDPTHPSVIKQIQDLSSPWKMRFYYLTKLPSALYWGLHVASCSPERAEVTIPYNRRTQNPFQSIYFAAQCGAAELSTGVLSLIATKGPSKVSMLVQKVEAEFTKTATDLTTFTCEDGNLAIDAIEKTIASGERTNTILTSTGRNQAGDIVSKFAITWSYKCKRV